MLKVYLIERQECEYDEYIGHVVIAHDENEARLIASKVRGDESACAWLDPKQSKVTEIEVSGEPRVILSDFLAG